MPTSSKARRILEPIFKRQPRHPGVAHYLIHLYDYAGACRKGPRRGQAICRDRAGGPARPAHAVAHLHAGRLSGRSRSPPISHRRVRQRATRSLAGQLHAMDYMVYAYLQLGQDRNAQNVVAEMVQVADNPDQFAYGYALGRESRRATRWNAVIGRAPRSCRSAEQIRLCRSDDAFCARARGGPQWQSRGGQGRHRQIGRTAREAARGEGRLLDRASRHSMAGRNGLAALCRGQVRRRAEGHERRRRCRGQDREASGDAGCPDSRRANSTA